MVLSGDGNAIAITVWRGRDTLASFPLTESSGPRTRRDLYSAALAYYLGLQNDVIASQLGRA